MGAGPVALVDTDPQGLLAEWWNARKAETPVFANVAADNIKAGLTDLRKSGVALTIIDPSNSEANAAVMAMADLVLIPVRAGPHDLRAVGATASLCEAANKKMVFVINAANTRAKLTGQAAIALSQHGTVAPVVLSQRQDFASFMIDGRTATELSGASKSADDIAELWEYVSKQLRK